MPFYNGRHYKQKVLVGSDTGELWGFCSLKRWETMTLIAIELVVGVALFDMFGRCAIFSRD